MAVAAAKGVLLSAGAGAIVALAGIYLAKKAKRYFRVKPKMRLVQNDILLSTRCAWFLSELGAEGDFQIGSNGTGYYSSDCLLPELDAEHAWLEQHSDHRHQRLVRQENDYQVVENIPSVSHEDLNTAAANCDGNVSSMDRDDDCSDYESQDRSVTPSRSACVVNDEFTLIEGAAICLYLADHYGQFLPGAEHRAEYYSWIVYSASTFDSIVKTLHSQLVETPECQRNSQVLESALSGFGAFARALSEALTTNDYLCGDSFTTADCVLGFTLWWAYTIDQGRLLDSYPVLLAYLEKLQSRPAFRKTFCPQDHRWVWGRYLLTYLRENLHS